MNQRASTGLDTARPVADERPVPRALRLAERTDVQLGGGILAACVLPAVLRWDLTSGQMFVSSSQFNPFIAMVLAVVTGWLVLHRLTRYPGVAAFSYVLPTFAVTYVVALGVVVFLRLDYSRFYFAASFAGTLVWFHLVHILSARASIPAFAVLPFGDTGRLAGINGVRWRFLERPHLDSRVADGLVADLRADLADDWKTFVAETAVSGVPVYHVKQVSESLTGRVEIEHLSENTLGSLLPGLIYPQVKRLADVAAAVLLLPVLIPLFLVLAAIIRADSPGPVFFRQERAGHRGRPFLMWKFRTMVHDRKRACRAGDRTASVTQENDPRITRVGRFLRRTRLDEFPQVINILKGEMSWIGPRPEALALSQWYETELPFYRYRHIVRPGITGWAQVNQGHVAAMDEVHGKLHYDFYYIKNFSVWLDMLVAIRTVATMLTGFGAR